MEFGETIDYYQQHQERLQAITARIEELVANADIQTIATKAGDDQEVTVLAGDPLPEVITSDYASKGIQISEQTAEAMAELYHKFLQSSAEIAIVLTQGLTTLRMHGCDMDAPELPAPLNREPEELPSYGRAIISNGHWQFADSGSIRLVNAQLNGIPCEAGETVSANSHTIEFEGGGLTQKLSLFTYDGEVCQARFDVQPTDDELQERCMRLLGLQFFTEVNLLLKGHFGTEADLASELNEVWLAHQGLATEEEIGPLLDEVRQRALAAQDSRDLHKEHRMAQPSPDKLAEFEALLGIV